MIPFLAPFHGHTTITPPCWFMRQAGRYLPEYRTLRKESGDFLTMCYTPELACEVTLQPIRRFSMDAAIIFSDILVVPQGLGRPLKFVTGEGPWVEPIKDISEVEALDIGNMSAFLSPVYEALSLTRKQLEEKTALIGFAGAPWTLLCYMLDGNGKTDFANARSMIYSKPELVDALMAVLVKAVAKHLIHQIDAGAQTLQLFDSWAAHIPARLRHKLLLEPTKQIIDAVRAVYPDVPLICFPRGIGAQDYVSFCTFVSPDGISVDQYTDIVWLSNAISKDIVLQGNLDPLALVHNINLITNQVQQLKGAMHERPFIMNLGHGVVQQTPPEHMKALVDAIRQ